MRQTSSSYLYQLLYDPRRRQLLLRRYGVRCLGTLSGVLVGLALLFWQPVTAAPLIAQPTPTPTATPPPMLQVGNGANAIRSYYQDPDGLYSIPVPQSWRSERQHEYLRLSSPQEQIQIYILTIPGVDVNKAIDQAWRQVDPAFAMSPKYTLEMPSLNDLEEIQTVTYDDGHPHSANLAMKLTTLPLQMEAVVTPAAPAGGAWSTAEDLGRYLLTLLNSGITFDGQQVVSPWNLGITWQPQVPVSANMSYGLGWVVDTYKGLRLLHHGGNTLGFTADLAFLPEANVGIAVLTNAQGVNFVTEAIRHRFLELLYDQEQRYDDYAHYRYEILRQYLGEAGNGFTPLDRAAIAPYLGRYYHEELGAIDLLHRDDRLLLLINGVSVELQPQATTTSSHERYVIYSPPLAGIPVQLTSSDQGKPRLISGAGAAQYTFTPQPLPTTGQQTIMTAHYP